jgi:hypothetical protein
MFPRNVTALRADALFVSALQRSDELSHGQIRQAVAVAVDTYGVAGCAGRVAQEFGDHPDTAAARMCWARAVVAGLDGQLVRSIRRMAGPTALPWAGGGAFRDQVGVVRLGVGRDQ